MAVSSGRRAFKSSSRSCLLCPCPEGLHRLVGEADVYTRVEGDAQGTEQGFGVMPGPALESGKAPKGSGE